MVILNTLVPLWAEIPPLAHRGEAAEADNPPKKIPPALSYPCVFVISPQRGGRWQTRIQLLCRPSKAMPS